MGSDFVCGEIEQMYFQNNFLLQEQQQIKISLLGFLIEGSFNSHAMAEAYEKP